MPVEFLTDDEAAAFGRFAGVPARADLERVFFLDDADLVLVLEDPLDVPAVVLDFVARQLGIGDPSVVKKYLDRRTTLFEHQLLIREADGWRDFSAAEADFTEWAAARAGTSGDGPKGTFNDGVAWLRQRRVLLPGVTTLARLVARVRREATERLWGELASLVTVEQRRVLDRLLEVAPGSRVSDLERWRKGVAPRASGPAIIKALDLVAEIAGFGFALVGVETRVPSQRLAELVKYGKRAHASMLRRHPTGRRVATLLATVRHLEGKAIDDALGLLDLLMATELLTKARNASDKDRIRKHPRLAKASARLAVAVEALFAADGWSGTDGTVRLRQIWEAIEDVVSRDQLRAALAVVSEDVPPADADAGDDWRSELVKRFPTVSGFLKVLT